MPQYYYATSLHKLNEGSMLYEAVWNDIAVLLTSPRQIFHCAYWKFSKRRQGTILVFIRLSSKPNGKGKKSEDKEIGRVLSWTRRYCYKIPFYFSPMTSTFSEKVIECLSWKSDNEWCTRLLNWGSSRIYFYWQVKSSSCAVMHN